MVVWSFVSICGSETAKSVFDGFVHPVLGPTLPDYYTNVGLGWVRFWSKWSLLHPSVCT